MGVLSYRSARVYQDDNEANEMGHAFRVHIYGRERASRASTASIGAWFVYYWIISHALCEEQWMWCCRNVNWLAQKMNLTTFNVSRCLFPWSNSRNNACSVDDACERCWVAQSFLEDTPQPMTLQSFYELEHASFFSRRFVSRILILEISYLKMKLSCSV